MLLLMENKQKSFGISNQKLVSRNHATLVTPKIEFWNSKMWSQNSYNQRSLAWQFWNKIVGLKNDVFLRQTL